MQKFMRIRDFSEETGIPVSYLKNNKVNGAMFKLNPALKNSPLIIDTDKMLKHFEKLGRYL